MKFRILSLLAGILVGLSVLAGPDSGETIVLWGEQKPSLDIEIAPARAGVIAKVFFEEGAKVKKGDALIALKSDIERASFDVAAGNVELAQANIDAAKAQRDLANKVLERETKLWEGKVTTDSEYEEVQLAQAVADLRYRAALETKRIRELECRRAEAILEELTICAPADGEIVRIYKEKAEGIEEHAPLIRFVNIDTLDVEAPAPINTLGKIVRGTRGVFVPDDLPDVIVPCVVTLVDCVADSAGGTYRVVAKIDNKDRICPPGVQGTLRLTVNK